MADSPSRIATLHDTPRSDEWFRKFNDLRVRDCPSALEFARELERDCNGWMETCRKAEDELEALKRSTVGYTSERVETVSYGAPKYGGAQTYAASQAPEKQVIDPSPAPSLPSSTAGVTAAEVLDKVIASIKNASERRYQMLKEHEAEAWKWKAEGDMYGWNFFSGMAAGCNESDICYYRALREAEELRKSLPSATGASK